MLGDSMQVVYVAAAVASCNVGSATHVINAACTYVHSHVGVSITAPVHIAGKIPAPEP